MADLPVVAVITAKAGSEQQVQQALTALVEPTRSEPGCVSYYLFVSAAVLPWRICGRRVPGRSSA